VLVRLGGYIASLSDFYSYKLIGKLTDFLQSQDLGYPIDSRMGLSITIDKLRDGKNCHAM
jgi:hypothetical protein